MSFRLLVPENRIGPLRWVADILFSGMLGVSVDVEGWAGVGIELSAEGRTLVMPSQFPDLAATRDRWREQMPVQPLVLWTCDNLPEVALVAPLPVLFGTPEIEMTERQIDCGMDILGTVFFMLSRFEEVVLPLRDEHERFPATASLAWAGGFLYRPVVDEYVEVLFALMRRLWPSLTRRARQGRVQVSCDVDQPFDSVGGDPIMLLRVLRHDLILKRKPAIAARRVANFAAHRFGDYRFDPYYTFNWYMDVCERYGRKAAFYFISDHSSVSMDGTYEIDEPRILALMRELSRRGHEIGMHGSYNTYLDGRRIANERQRLEAAVSTAGIGGAPLGNRQHYLRWDAAETPDLLDAAGFEYDATGAFADRPGFRYGTSHPFPMWSWKSLAPLRLIQRPLVLMEGSVLSEKYLGMGHTAEAMDLMQMLRRRALRYGGDFNFLWHNSEFFSPRDREFFETLLS